MQITYLFGHFWYLSQLFLCYCHLFLTLCTMTCPLPWRPLPFVFVTLLTMHWLRSCWSYDLYRPVTWPCKLLVKRVRLPWFSVVTSCFGRWGRGRHCGWLGWRWRVEDNSQTRADIATDFRWLILIMLFSKSNKGFSGLLDFLFIQFFLKFLQSFVDFHLSLCHFLVLLLGESILMLFMQTYNLLFTKGTLFNRRWSSLMHNLSGFFLLTKGRQSHGIPVDGMVILFIFG